MPFAEFRNFADCLDRIRQRDPSLSEDEAKRICGKLQAVHEDLARTGGALMVDGTAAQVLDWFELVKPGEYVRDDAGETVQIDAAMLNGVQLAEHVVLREDPSHSYARNKDLAPVERARALGRLVDIDLRNGSLWGRFEFGNVGDWEIARKRYFSRSVELRNRVNTPGGAREWTLTGVVTTNEPVVTGLAASREAAATMHHLTTLAKAGPMKTGKELKALAGGADLAALAKHCGLSEDDMKAAMEAGDDEIPEELFGKAEAFLKADEDEEDEMKMSKDTEALLARIDGESIDDKIANLARQAESFKAERDKFSGELAKVTAQLDDKGKAEVALLARVEALETATKTQERQRRIDACIYEQRITPAQAQRRSFTVHLDDFEGKPDAEFFARLDAEDMKPATVTTGDKLRTPSLPDGTATVGTLEKEAIALCRAEGKDLGELLIEAAQDPTHKFYAITQTGRAALALN